MPLVYLWGIQVGSIDLRPCSRFKFGPFLVSHRRNVLALVAGVVIVNMVLAAQLTPAQDVPHLFPDDHAIQVPPPRHI